MSQQRILSLKKAIVIAVIYTLLFFAYGYYTYVTAHQKALQRIDRELVMGAKAVSLLLPKNFHHEDLNRDTLSYTEDLENIQKLSDFVSQTNLSYIYSFLIDKNGSARFASSSANKEDLESNKSDIYAFDNYDDINIHILLSSGKLGKPLFLETKDKWGSFRSAYILMENSDGYRYIVGSDYDQTSLQSLSHTILGKVFFLIIPLVFFVIFYVLANYMTVQYLKENIRLKRRELKRAYEYDELTKLSNKKRLMLTLHSEHNIQYLALFDINKFSLLNDIYGYAYANLYLKFCATFLSTHLEEGMKLYRGDADLFIITYTKAVSENKFEEMMLQLLQLLKEQKFVDNGYESSLEFTVGMARVSQKNTPLIEAELALKEAKRSRTLMQYYTAQMDQNQHYKNVLDDIAYAIDNKKVFAYYQPIQNVKTGKIYKYEALMRLEKRDGQLVAPEYFLALAKKTVSYEKLTMIMVNHVIEIAQKYPNEHFSMNMSSLDIENTEMMQKILNSIFQAKVGKQLTLEILESEAFHDTEDLMAFVKQCHEEGLCIAIDDFGSGYSNIANTIRLDIDYLKIDGSLILHILEDERYEKALKSILVFAQEIGAVTIAEFVEDEKIAEKVKILGVDMLQGYYIGKPSPKLLSFS